ncbi:hypothetical protein IV203_034165 [Nitzschia inconspicua]|uniref:Uncharacterized protein n=1 Tax=Nitzschia inconspicua TaxID=303405 RepID=A0A9K3M782_9STRA|nr:hypothetical protein IV203_034165 [Nitzschia inconspicua]
MSDEEEVDFTLVFYRDTRDGLLTSAADKQRKALKHLNYFLEGYCVQIGIGVVKAEDIPYHGISLKASEKEAFEFWDKLYGAFTTYLGSHARSGCNPKGQRISPNTADGYLSSTKAFFVNKFRIEPAIPVFQKTQ